MLEEINALRPPNPILTFKGPPGPTIARWVEHKRQTMHVADLFQDFARHPWVGERQAGTAANLYTMTARNVDAELRKLPYAQRLELPQSGAYPVVTGAEIGTGPNPWDVRSNQRYSTQRKNLGEARGPIVPATRSTHAAPGEGPAAPARPAVIIPRRVDPMDFVHTTNLPIVPTPKGGPPAPRSFVDRLKNVGGHLANSTGEVAASAAAGAGAYVASGGNPVATRAAMRTGSGVYRYFAPRTGRRAGRGNNYTGQVRQGVRMVSAARASMMRRNPYNPGRTIAAG